MSISNLCSALRARLFIIRPALLFCSVALLPGCPDNTSTRTESDPVKNTANETTPYPLINCKVPLGTAALVENDIPGLTQVGLPSPIPILRLMMAKSGCFQVVDRGRASELMRKERELLKEGELEKGSGPSPGQMIAVNYLLTPDIIFQDEDAGGHSFQIGLGGAGSGLLGLLGGGIDTTNIEAQTLLTLTNIHTGLQEGIAEGSARKQDVSYGAGLIALQGLGLGAGLSAYEDTDIGKLTVLAFQNAYNKLVNNLANL